MRKKWPSDAPWKPAIVSRRRLSKCCSSAETRSSGIATEFAVIFLPLGTKSSSETAANTISPYSLCARLEEYANSFVVQLYKVAIRGRPCVNHRFLAPCFRLVRAEQQR